MNFYRLLPMIVASLSLSQTVQANAYQQAMAFFNGGDAADLQRLIPDDPQILRTGRCAQIYNTNQVQDRAFVALPINGEFGRTLFIGFEFYSQTSSDQSILAAAEYTHQNHWGDLYKEFGRTLQSSYRTLGASHFHEYRTSVNADGETYLIRKYYADEGVFGPNRRMYIAAFDPIEFCWVKIP